LIGLDFHLQTAENPTPEEGLKPKALEAILLLTHLILIEAMDYHEELCYPTDKTSKDWYSFSFFFNLAINQKKETFLMLHRLTTMLLSISETFKAVSPSPEHEELVSMRG
jgi:hypothetical protein